MKAALTPEDTPSGSGPREFHPPKTLDSTPVFARTTSKELMPTNPSI
jgi:hypothetical protein